MVFVREGCPYCSKLLEELEKTGFDFRVFDIDSRESIEHLKRMGMLVKEPPLLQTPNNFYVLPDFFDDCQLERYDEELLEMIMRGLTYIWN
jgi:glutaredoxin